MSTKALRLLPTGGHYDNVLERTHASAPLSHPTVRVALFVWAKRLRPVELSSTTYCQVQCGTRRLIARTSTCKVFGFARKLNTAPADLECRPRPPLRIGLGLGLGLGLGSGLGSGWSGRRNRRFVRTCK